MNRLALIALAALPAFACDPVADDAHTEWAPDRSTRPAEISTPALPAVDACDASVLRWRFAYDTTGNRVLAERYEGGDETPARVETRRFDDAGRIVEAGARWAGGYVDVRLERDAAGVVVGRTIDASHAEQEARAELVERTASRQVTRYAGPVLLLDPFDPITERTPSAADRDAIHDPLVRTDAILGSLVRHIDTQTDVDRYFAAFEVVEVRTFDAAGRPVGWSWDYDGDGEPEEIERWTHLSEGEVRVVVREEDHWGDGTIDRRVIERYDAAGHQIEQAIEVTGLDGPQSVWQRAYDAAGLLVEELSLPAAGPSRLTTYARLDGMTVTEVDEAGDGRVDHRTTLHVRSDGKRVLKQEDAGADGVVDWQKRYVYDAAGRRVYDERDRDMNGQVDQRWDYGYDAEGRLLHEVRTEPGSAACAGLGG